MIDKEIRQAIESEAEAAEEVAVYNQNLIHRLERRVTALEFANVAQAEYIELLTRLVVRMGQVLQAHHRHLCPWITQDQQFSFTPAGQREYDADKHEADGEPPTRESEGAWGHE